MKKRIIALAALLAVLLVLLGILLFGRSADKDEGHAAETASDQSGLPAEEPEAAAAAPVPEAEETAVPGSEPGAEETAAPECDAPETDVSETEKEPAETAEICGRQVDRDTVSLDLSDAAITEPGQLTELAQLPALEDVDLTGCILTAEEMKAISEAYPSLRLTFRTEIAGIEVRTDAEELDLSGNRINGTDKIKELLPYFGNLSELVMCDCGISNEDMAELRDENPEISVVWRLHMGVYSLRTDAEVFSTLVGLGEDSVLTDSDVQVLRYCTDLKALDLGHHALCDISFLEDLPDLRLLILSDNSISDLTPIAGLTNLTYLELFMNYNVTSLEPLSQLTKLRDLNLCFLTKITDYECLYGLPLERLWINGCGVSEAQKEALREHLPGCVVYDNVAHDAGSTGGGWRTCLKHYAQHDMFRFGYYDDLFD